MPAPQIAALQKMTPQRICRSSEPPINAGSCVLANAGAADIVQQALRRFDGERYVLHAWCVMPNHVHVVFAPLVGHQVSAILHTWKSYTAKVLNKFLERTGAFWERESFDHLIRSVEQMEQFKAYVEDNPVKAGLVLAKQDYSFSSAGVEFKHPVSHFVDPRQTPFVEPNERGELPHLDKPGGTYFVTFRLRDAVASSEEPAESGKSTI